MCRTAFIDVGYKGTCAVEVDEGKESVNGALRVLVSYLLKDLSVFVCQMCTLSGQWLLHFMWICSLCSSPVAEDVPPRRDRSIHGVPPSVPGLVHSRSIPLHPTSVNGLVHSLSVH
jgi:hypothetical protein